MKRHEDNRINRRRWFRKTQILEYLNDKYGATICQADKVAKHLQKKGTECYDQIVAYFGEDILDEKKSWTVRKLRISYLQTKPN
ncbi:MAG: dephospho-CoA kinase [Lachnospiraceae bacterium]